MMMSYLIEFVRVVSTYTEVSSVHEVFEVNEAFIVPEKELRMIQGNRLLVKNLQNISNKRVTCIDTHISIKLEHLKSYTYIQSMLLLFS